MLSPADVFALVCGCMQVLSFTHELIDVCSKAYKGKSLEPELEARASSIIRLSENVRRRNAAISQAASDTEIREIRAVADRCNKAAQKLENELREITARASSGRFWTAVRAAELLKRKRALETLRKELSDYQQDLQTHLLARSSNKIEAVELLHAEEFSNLNRSTQALVRQLATDSTNLSNLIEAKSRHIIEEAVRSEQVLKDHVSLTSAAAQGSIERRIDEGLFATSRNLQDTAAIKRQQEKLLCSLKFPSMMDRQNRIDDMLYCANEDTFAWIFDADSKSLRARIKHDEWDHPVEWLESDSKVFWLSGKPGSGKSTFVRFLAKSPKTVARLQKWNSDAIVFFHSFWKPGSAMQRNIRGFWCSIIHHLIRCDGGALDSTMSSMHVADKDDHSDWTLEDLITAWDHILQLHAMPICIFLDGLDEVYGDDSAKEIFQLISKLESYHTVKLFLSSRAEPKYVVKFRNCEQLQLHHVTHSDILEFAIRELQPLWADLSISSQEQQYLVELLAQKAEGVFLWVQLAIKSLYCRLDPDAGFSDLSDGIDELPAELSSLYEDMWNRQNGLGGKTKFHRAEAAYYFNLLLDMRFDSRVPDVKQCNCKALNGRDPNQVYLIEVALAKDAKLQAQVFEHGGDIDEYVVEEACRKTRGAITSKCAGLVHVYPHFRQGGAAMEHYGVSFIHRTAFDFIADTEHGAHIRSFDTSTAEQRRWHMVKSACGVWILSPTGGYPEDALRNLAMLSNQETRPQMEKILEACARWWVVDLEGMDYLPNSELSASFLARVIILGRPVLTNWVLDRIMAREDRGQVSARLLSDVLDESSGWVNDPRYELRMGLMEQLIALGTDFRLVIGPEEHVECTRSCPRSIRLRGIPLYAQFLRRALLTKRFDTDLVRRLLNSILTMQVDFDQRVPAFAIATHKSDDRYIRLFDSIWQRDGGSAGDIVVLKEWVFSLNYFCIFIETDVAFLLKVLSQRVALEPPRRSGLHTTQPYFQVMSSMPYSIGSSSTYHLQSESTSKAIRRHFEPLASNGFSTSSEALRLEMNALEESLEPKIRESVAPLDLPASGPRWCSKIDFRQRNGLVDDDFSTMHMF